MVKTLTLPRLVKKADAHFSRLVRERDKDKGCITCGRFISPSEAHAGHFIPRGCKLTRFDPRNVNLQCPRCNTFMAGEQYKHGVAIDKKFGEGTADKLIALEREYKKIGHKFTRGYLQEILDTSTL